MIPIDGIVSRPEFEELSTPAKNLYVSLSQRVNGTPLKTRDVIGDAQTDVLAFVELKSEGFIVETAGKIYFPLIPRKKKFDKKKEDVEKSQDFSTSEHNTLLCKVLCSKLTPKLYSRKNKIIIIKKSRPRARYKTTAEERGIDAVRERFTPEVQQFILYWYSKGFTIHQPQSKTLKQMGKDVQNLIDGFYFSKKPGYRKYNKGVTFDEFRKIVDLYCLRFEPDYLPFHKNALPKSLSKFLFNDYAKICQSFYIDVYENGSPMIPAQDPEIQALIREYKRNFLGDVNYTPSPSDYEKFQLAVKKLKEYMLHNSKNYPGMTQKHMFNLLVRSIAESDLDGKVVTPGWLCSEHTLKYRLPFYLKNKLVTESPQSEYSVEEIERKLNKW